jgi:hypothetical protein
VPVKSRGQIEGMRVIFPGTSRCFKFSFALEKESKLSSKSLYQERP